MTDRAFLPVEEACERMGLSLSALRRRRDQGEIRFYASPSDRRRRLVDVRDLEQLISPVPVDGRRARREAGKA